jgi:hypothetical protein
MLEIKSIDVKPNYSSFYLITWALVDTTESADDYTFAVYKSLSPGPASTFELVADNIVGFNYAYDVPNKLNSSIHEYFKIEITQISTGDKVLSPVTGASYIVPADPFADAIIYQEEYFLDYVLNRPSVKLLVKRRSGTRCTVCWDDTLQEVTKSACTACYTTGYTGGYMPAQDIMISFTEPLFQTKFDMGDIKDVQQGPTVGWTKNYPLILPSDIIVDEFNRRFRVIQVQPTTKDGRIYLRQNLQLQLIPPTDIIYQFPV